MLRLIQAEFLKLRRKKFIVLMLLSALFMPLLAVFYFRSADKTVIEPLQFYKWTTFSYTAWIIVFTQGQFSFGEKRYIDDAGWFMNAAQSLATFFVLPAVIALLGSYMICREEQEDTIKSLRLIPISEAKMTIAKLLITLHLAYSFICCFSALHF